jgi:hypothetical protein
LKRLVIGALVVLATTTVGCQQATEKVAQKAVEQATGVQINQKGDQVTLKGADGEAITFGSQVPDELKNFPVPQGFKLAKDGFGSMSSKGDTMSVGSWEGSGTADSVLDFYKNTMPGQGWTEDYSFSADTGGQVSYTKGQNGALVSIDKADNVTKISVLMGKSSGQNATPSAGGSGSGSSSFASNLVASVPTKAPTAVPTKAATATPSKPAATSTPAPPKTGSNSSIPEEMKQIPVPAGFSVVDGSTIRQASGGVFAMAGAEWFGKASVTDAVTFFKTALANDWNEDFAMASNEDATAQYSNKKNPKLSMVVAMSKEDAGTSVNIILSQSK